MKRQRSEVENKIEEVKKNQNKRRRILPWREGTEILSPTFDRGERRVRVRTETEILVEVRGSQIDTGHESRGLYYLSPPLVACNSAPSPVLLHSHLGHPSLSKFQKMVLGLPSLSNFN